MESSHFALEIFMAIHLNSSRLFQWEYNFSFMTAEIFAYFGLDATARYGNIQASKHLYYCLVPTEQFSMSDFG